MTNNVWSFRLWWEAQVRIALRTLQGQELHERLDHLIRIGEQNI